MDGTPTDLLLPPGSRERPPLAGRAPGARMTAAAIGLLCGLGVVGPGLSAGAAPAPGGAGQAPGARRRPPEFVTCDWSRLTSFTGRVVRLSRGDDRTSLTVETDWDTTESFVVRRSGRGRLDGLFLGGRPFTRDDWGLILDEGAPRDGLRATVWVCQDEDDPKVDWEIPPRR